MIGFRMSLTMTGLHLLLLLVVSPLSLATDVHIDDHHVHQVSPQFVSFTLDSSIFEPQVRQDLNFSSTRLHTLLQAMSPAILRVGGSPADWLVFNRPSLALNASGLQPTPVVMSKSDWDSLVGITSKAGLRLLFDLNLQRRFGLQWDASSAIELFEYCASQGYGDNLDWELGNEPSVYTLQRKQAQLTSKQIGQDFVSLYRTLRSYEQFDKSRLVGPDIVGGSKKSTDIINGYLDVAGGVVDALTIHHYYFRGDTAHWHDYINASHFRFLGKTLQEIQTLVKQSRYPDTPIWIGETSDAWHGGTPNVSDRFVSGFLWLDKLGVSAAYGVDIVMRQTFWGHNYGLTEKDFFPNPDFWLSWLYKNLVGTKVLNVSLTNQPISTRVYGHCVNPRTYKPGGIVIFALNVNQTSSDTLMFSDQRLRKQIAHLYLAEPGDDHGMLSRYVKINGIRLSMIDEHKMPTVHPMPWHASQGVTIKPTTYAFIVFPEAKFDVCMN